MAVSDEVATHPSEHVGTWVVHLDVRGCCTFSSALATNFLGDPGRELTGRNLIQMLKSRAVDGLPPGLVESIETRGPLETVQIFLRCSDGGVAIVELNGEPEFDEQGVYVGFWVICRDMTSQRREKGEMLRERAELEQRADERAVRLEKANAVLKKQITRRRRTADRLREAVGRLEESDGQRSQFVNNVSHDLRTPVTSMQFALTNLLRGTEGPLSEGVVDYLKLLLDDCARLATTVNDILDLSRIESNTLQLMRVPVSFGRLATRVARALNVQAAERRLALHVNVPDDCGFVDGDIAKLERVLQNVISNAIKYTADGGSVYVTFAKRRPRTKWLTLDVVDTGIGIATEHLRKVTKPFYRVGEQASGTGLGLYIAKELIGKHGGRLAITSSVNRENPGTRVRIQLPARAAPCVLVVDDCTDARCLVDTLLRYAGYHVVTACDGAAALDVLRKMPVDLVLMDLIMPGMDGACAIAQIRANHAWRHIPIIMATAGEPDHVQREILDGFGIPVIPKPWKSDQLLDALEDAFAGKKYLNVTP
ncbi:MAG: response regulator [Verrucomicrobia bacterium]|nr:response regulator [Verrucomicrobiota bacterium]MDA1086569.1 response regulator [Verrucomicrobiota bacterium]